MLHPRGLLRSISWIQPSRSFRFATGSASGLTYKVAWIYALVSHTNSDNLLDGYERGSPRLASVGLETIGVESDNDEVRVNDS